MMYNSKLAAAIKVAGKVLREYDKDKVYLPFGSEYSIFLKNKNSVRAVAHVVIDGKDIGDGCGFVVPAFGEITIERFVTNNNLEEGNRLKFIERSGAVEAHRGIGIDDGLVEIQFRFEHRAIPGGWDWRNKYEDIFPRPSIYNLTGSDTPSATYRSRSRSSTGSPCITPQNETGITAPGSISDQSFTDAGHFPLEHVQHSMVFHLLGETEDNQEIREVLTVKHKPRCVSCGTINRHDAKFCSECGTSLQIL